MKGKTRIWTGMALLFIGGMAVGFFGASYLIRKQVREFVVRGPGGMSSRVADHALEDIDLSEEQRNRIDEIMADVRPRMRELSDRFGESVRDLTEEQFERIRAVLDEEQVTAFDSRIDEMERRMDMIRDRRGRRLGRPPHGRRGHGEERPH